MKVLIVSFDRTLTERLSGALRDHEVYVAKNSEEAMKVIPQNVDVVIYDAISGAISEGDINTLYTEKFSDARYIILYDDLFPVDEGNIIVPQKLLLPRETDPKEVASKLTEVQPTVREPETTQEIQEFEIEPTYLGGVPEVEPAYLEGAPQEGGNKVLIVSFDRTLIDSLKASLEQRYEVLNAKTVKQAVELAREADLIIFDAISGAVAERTLVEMASDERTAGKPFLILLDDLFPINVEGIPLERKVSLPRDTDPERIRKIVDEELRKYEQVPAQREIEEPPAELEVEVEPTFEEEIPALEALERIMEGKGIELEEAPQETFQAEPQAEIGKVDLDGLIRDAVAKALSEERIRGAIEGVLRESMKEVRDMVLEVVRQEVEKVFEELDIKSLVKQTTYQALKEKLEELIS